MAENKVNICPECGEEMDRDDAICLWCEEALIAEWPSALFPQIVVDDPGRRCDCEDAPCCGC